MSLRIQNNTEAFNAHRALENTSDKLSKSIERLSSGYRINRAADDAAGLTISEKLRAQITGVSQAQRNAQDAISMVSTAEGALGEVHAMLQRVRELAVQYDNGTLSTSDKVAVQSEVTQLQGEIARIGSQTTFNDVALLTGTTTITFQIGGDDGQTLTVSTINLYGSGAAIDSSIFSFGTTAIISDIDTAIANVSDA